jgi:hypothetical protein
MSEESKQENSYMDSSEREESEIENYHHSMHQKKIRFSMPDLSHQKSSTITWEELGLETTENRALYTIPPNFKMAKFHGIIYKVRLIGKSIDVRLLITLDLDIDQEHHAKGNAVKMEITEEDMCPWWKHFMTEQSLQRFKMSTKVLNLKTLGTGFPLYFYFKFFVAITFLILWVLVSVPSIIINILQGDGDQWTEDDEAASLTVISLGNHGKNPKEYHIGSAADAIVTLNSVCILILLVLFKLFGLFQISKVNKMDQDQITPSDFAVMAYNIQKDINPDELKEWLEKTHEIKDIMNIIYWYDIRKVIDLIKQKKNDEEIWACVYALENRKIIEIDEYAAGQANPSIEEESPVSLQKENPSEHEEVYMTKILWYKKPYPTLLEAVGKVKKLNREIKKEIECMSNDHSSEGEFTGKAFIILDNQNEAERVANIFGMGRFTRSLNYFFYKICWCKKKKNEQFYLRDKRIKMERAAEPTDLIWENLNTPTSIRVRKAFITYLVTFLILVGSFFINLILGEFKDRLDENIQEDNNGSDLVAYTILGAISLANGLIISIINFTLGQAVRILTNIENHTSYTRYHLSVMVKLVLAMFINTALIPLALNYSSSEWFTSSGLVGDIFFNTLSTCFFGPLMYIFTPMELYKSYLRWKENKKGKRSKLTQRQLNIIYEGQTMDLAQRYANAMLLLLLWCTYTVLMPILPVIWVFGAIYQYWITKWMLLRYHKKPKQIGEVLDKSARRLLPFALLAYAGSQFFFINRLSDNKNWTVIIPLCGIIFYFMVPINYLERKLGLFKVHRDDSATYTVYKDTFEHEDYHSCNPVKFEDHKSGLRRMNLSYLKAYGAEEDIEERIKRINNLINKPLVAHTKLGSERRVSSHHRNELSSIEHIEPQKSKMTSNVEFNF